MAENRPSLDRKNIYPLFHTGAGLIVLIDIKSFFSRLKFTLKMKTSAAYVSGASARVADSSKDRLIWMTNIRKDFFKQILILPSFFDNDMQ